MGLSESEVREAAGVTCSARVFEEAYGGCVSVSSIMGHLVDFSKESTNHTAILPPAKESNAPGIYICWKGVKGCWNFSCEQLLSIEQDSVGLKH